MSIIFSRSCEYATQAVLFLARAPQGEAVLLRDISLALGIPHHFLNKVLQLLTHHGIVTSQKGTNGGFSLAKSAHTITLDEIIHAIDGEGFLAGCVLGFPNCGDDDPCPVHAHWKRARGVISDMLTQKTVAELSKTLNGKLRTIEQGR